MIPLRGQMQVKKKPADQLNTVEIEKENAAKLAKKKRKKDGCVYCDIIHRFMTFCFEAMGLAFLPSPH